MQNYTSNKVNWYWIDDAWKLYSSNISPWIIMMLITTGMSLVMMTLFFTLYPLFSIAMISAASQYYEQSIEYGSGVNTYAPIIIWILLFLLVVIAWFIISVFFITGSYKAAIKHSLEGKILIGDLFSGGNRFWSILVFMFLIALFFGGTHYILWVALEKFTTDLIYPGLSYIVSIFIPVILFIIAISGMFFVIPEIIHGHKGIFEAIRRSFQLTGSNRISYFFLTIVVYALGISGSLFLGIGAVFTLPFIFLIPSVAYLKVIEAEALSGSP